MALPAYHVNGPCLIKYNGVILGKCKEPVVIRPKVTWTPILVDGFGTAPAGFIFGGRSAVVEVLLSEAASGSRGYTELTQDMFPNGLFSLLTNTANDPLRVGELGSLIALALSIEELAYPSVPGSPYEWIAPLAILADPAELVLNATSEQQFPLTFLLIPDPTTAKIFTTIPSYIQ